MGKGFREDADDSHNNPHIVEIAAPMNLTLVGADLNTGCTGFKNVDDPAAGLKFSLPRKSNVVVKGITVNGSYSFFVNTYIRVSA